MRDVTNHDRAIAHLQSAAEAESTMSTERYTLAAAQIYALLDIADAIREHTARTTHPAGKDATQAIEEFMKSAQRSEDPRPLMNEDQP